MAITIFNTFDDPSASTGTTFAFGVNDTDQIVGHYRIGGCVYRKLDSARREAETR